MAKISKKQETGARKHWPSGRSALINQSDNFGSPRHQNLACHYRHQQHTIDMSKNA